MWWEWFNKLLLTNQHSENVFYWPVNMVRKIFLLANLFYWSNIMVRVFLIFLLANMANMMRTFFKFFYWPITMVRLFYFSLSPCSQYGECHGDILLMGDDDEDIDDDTDTKSKQRIWTTAVVLSLANLSPQCCQAVIVVIDIFCHYLSSLLLFFIVTMVIVLISMMAIHKILWIFIHKEAFPQNDLTWRCQKGRGLPKSEPKQDLANKTTQHHPTHSQGNEHTNLNNGSTCC